jgi:hypothetical protein
MDDKTDDGTHGFRGGFISHPDILYYIGRCDFQTFTKCKAAASNSAAVSIPSQIPAIQQPRPAAAPEFQLSSSLQTRPSSSPRHNLLACPLSSIIETQSPPDTQSLSLLLLTTSFPSLAQKSAKQVPRVFPNRKSQLAERYARPIVKQQSKGGNKKKLFLDDPTSFSYISRSQTSLFGFNCGGNNSIVWRS